MRKPILKAHLFLISIMISVGFLHSHLSAQSKPTEEKDESSAITLSPIYVGHGSSTVLEHGCSLSVFDAGGTDQLGFKRLQRYYKANTGQEKYRDINYMLISHAHKDHNRYIKSISKDNVKVSTLISNKKVELKRKNLGIDRLRVTRNEIYHGVSINNYKIETLSMVDDKNCSNEVIHLDLFWGSTDSAELKKHRRYLRKKENNDSVVAGIRGNIIPVLFLGDANIPAQKLLMENAIEKLRLYQNGIIIAGHHGIPNGYHEELYDFLKPQKIIISRKSNTAMNRNIIDSMSQNILNSKGTKEFIVHCNENARRNKIEITYDLTKKENCKTNAAKEITRLSPNETVSIDLKR